MPTWWREGKSAPSFSDGKLFGEVASAYGVSILFYHSCALEYARPLSLPKTLFKVRISASFSLFLDLPRCHRAEKLLIITIMPFLFNVAHVDAERKISSLQMQFCGFKIWKS